MKRWSGDNSASGSALIKKLHIYCGLLSLSQLMVYGIAGLTASLQPALERPKPVRSVRFVPFTPSPLSTDKQVADQVYIKLNLPLARPMPDWFLKHTPENDLQLDFYTINGIFRVIVLEKEQRLKIEEIRNNISLFLEDLHAGTARESEIRLLRIWGLYNEFAMFSLIGLSVSGAFLWLSSRPKLRWAAVCAATSFAVAAAVYGLAR